MNWICAGVAGLAALCLYLASPHQTIWPAALRRQAFLRWLAVPLVVGAVAAAAEVYGAWLGVGIALAGHAAALAALFCADRRRRSD
jgi:hypothetical protein